MQYLLILMSTIAAIAVARSILLSNEIRSISLKIASLEEEARTYRLVALTAYEDLLSKNEDGVCILKIKADNIEQILGDIKETFIPE